jgi:hypothetical protein
MLSTLLTIFLIFAALASIVYIFLRLDALVMTVDECKPVFNETYKPLSVSGATDASFTSVYTPSFGGSVANITFNGLLTPILPYTYMEAVFPLPILSTRKLANAFRGYIKGQCDNSEQSVPFLEILSIDIEKRELTIRMLANGATQHDFSFNIVLLFLQQ